MITTKLSANAPTVPPMHHEPEDATDDRWREEGRNSPTPPMHGSLEGTTRNV